ncbi:MAG: hypothetical protein EXQ53_10120 [Acidobacteria bacterium]|nr:hypothetical protein [Acidobacteriota bacterium]
MTLEEFRVQLRETQGEIKNTVEHASTVRVDLDQVRGTAAQLSQDYTRLRDASKTAREDSVAAAETVKDLERKLGPLMQLQELSKTTEEKLTGLNALAEHVSQKAKTLESQKHTVERSVIEANRLNEMAWNMDVQINRLNEGLKEAQRSEETLGRIGTLVQQTNATVETAAKARDDLARESARFEKDGRALVDNMRSAIERLALEKKESEALDLRLRSLQGAVREAEARMEALGTKERNLSQIHQKVDTLGQHFQGLSVQADELAKKQAGLEMLHERLGQVEELARRTALEHETLKQGRQELETLRGDIHEFHKSHAQIAGLRDSQAADRAALDAFSGRMTAFMVRTPQLDATLNAINGKLAEQLARRTELDTLKSQCETVLAQTLDAQQQIEAVSARQRKLLPVTGRLSALEGQIEKTKRRFREVVRDEAVVREQETRLAECVEASRALAAETTERMKQTQALSDELIRAAAIKEELMSELARIQTHQRDASTQVEATEDQVKRPEAMYKQLDQRRSQLAFSEK